MRRRRRTSGREDWDSETVTATHSHHNGLTHLTWASPAHRFGEDTLAAERAQCTNNCNWLMAAEPLAEPPKQDCFCGKMRRKLWHMCVCVSIKEKRRDDKKQTISGNQATSAAALNNAADLPQPWYPLLEFQKKNQNWSSFQELLRASLRALSPKHHKNCC